MGHPSSYEIGHYKIVDTDIMLTTKEQGNTNVARRGGLEIIQ